MKAINLIANKIAPLSIILLILALVSSSSIAWAAASPGDPSQAYSGAITGRVHSPDNSLPPTGTLVKLFEPGTENVKGQAQPNPVNGDFSFPPVPNGLYLIKAVPPAASLLTQSFPRLISIFNANVNVGVIKLTNSEVTGTVFAPGGITPAAADVLVQLGNGQVLQTIPAPSGKFRIGGLPLGSYALRAIPTGNDPYWKSALVSLSISDVNPPAPQTVDINLRHAELWGTIKKWNGVPSVGAKVIVARSGANTASDFSNAYGYWAIGGLTDGSYTLTALPPWPDNGLMPVAPMTVTVPSSGPINLILPASNKIVTGTVKTNTHLNVAQALVEARRVNAIGQAQALTDNNGAYSLGLSSGLWALTVKVSSDTNPGSWVYPLPPQLVAFRYNNDPETQNQDFTVLVSDANAHGIIQLPDGGVPPFTVTVGLHSDEGVGLHTKINPADGSFSLNLPSGGYKVAIHPHDPRYLAPVIDPITIPPGGSYDLGIQKLLARDAIISGTVSAAGQPVEGIPVSAWREGVPGSVDAATGPDGQYLLAVSAGNWHVQPALGPLQPYLYTGSGQDISLRSGDAAQNIDFSLTSADATITGSLVDSNNAPVTSADGWAAAYQPANPLVHNGAPIQNGAFVIHVPAGTYNVAARLPAGSDFVSSSEKSVVVPAGGNADVTLTVLKKDASIKGILYDPRQNDNHTVVGVHGAVSAWSGSSWALTPINAGDGGYKLDVSAGLWRVNYRIDPNAPYVKLAGPVNIPLETGQSIIHKLPVTYEDGIITGTVKRPDGSPLPEAVVHAHGKSGIINDLWLYAVTGPQGQFSLKVPHGHYRIGAAGGDPSWIKPIEREIDVPVNGVSGANTLQFLAANAMIDGGLTVNNAPSSGQVSVWAWSDEGGFVRNHFPVTLDSASGKASGHYQLNVNSNTTWHLGAAFENETSYWTGHASVTLTGTQATQDLTLDGPHGKPAPVVVRFDPTSPQQISLADGTEIYIPGGALPVSGTVTLRIVPIATLPQQAHANMVKYGYSFLASDENGQPIETHFDQDVVISFKYNEAELQQQHVHEQWLKPAYYSTTTDRWTFPDSYVLDTTANKVEMQIDHFTDFSLTEATGYALYMPLTQAK